MPPDRSSSRDGKARVFAALEAAVPAQHEAKAALRTQFAVFRAQGRAESLTAEPVLLCANRPGRMPSMLVRALAEETDLPFLEVSVAHGLCVEQIVSQLVRLSLQCDEHRGFGVVLVKDLEALSAAAAQSLATCLRSSDRIDYLHMGREVRLSAQQVFWVGSLALPEPSRQERRDDLGPSGASFAFLAVGPSAADVVAAGVAGPMRAACGAAEQAACLSALEETFTSQAWLLPGTADELVAWAGHESAAWWPGRWVRAFCEDHGVALRLVPGAAEALAAAAMRDGGTLEAMEARFRDAMKPVFASIADLDEAIAAVELTAAAMQLDEMPRLVPGPRAPLPSRSAAGQARDREASGADRPRRTPQSPPDVRLARAEDLSALLAPDATPDVPPDSPCPNDPSKT
ncbi:MAG: hypothetical protein ACKV19_09070 [Verrucomicrobiales bacterium]